MGNSTTKAAAYGTTSMSAGRPVVWGANMTLFDGLLYGDGTQGVMVNLPYLAMPGGGVTATSIDDQCAVLSTGDAVFWSAPGASVSTYNWDAVPQFASVARSLFAQHECGLSVSGAIRCFGENTNGQLGLGDNADRASFTLSADIAFASPTIVATQVVVGFQSACALFANAQVRCWGRNDYYDYGILGQGHTRPYVGADPSDMTSIPFISFATPTDLVTSLSMSAYSVCALFAVGKIRCWGPAGYGTAANTQVGARPSDMSTLAFVSFATTDLVVQISSGGMHTCCSFANGQIRCFGANNKGQLGIGDTIDHISDVQTLGFITFSDTVPALRVSSGVLHSCADFANGRIRCWGWNQYGQLGYDHSQDVGDDPGEMASLPYVVQDDPFVLSWSSNTYSAGEGTTVTVTVVRSGGTCVLGLGCSVSLSDSPVSSLPATAGLDYQTLPSSMDCEQLCATQTFTLAVVINEDNLNEPNEQFTLTLSSIVPSDRFGMGTFGPGGSVATITIVDNDPFTLGFGSLSYSVTEAGAPTSVVVTVHRSGGACVTSALCSVALVVVPGAAGASSGLDYVPLPATLDCDQACISVFTITVNLIVDSLSEPTESLVLSLGAITALPQFGSGVVNTTAQATTVSIFDDDPFALGFTTAYFAVTEAAGVQVTLTLTRTGGGYSSGPCFANLLFTSSNATAGSDYVSAAAVNCSTPATTLVTVVTISDDLVYEPQETIAITLDSITPGSGTGLIAANASSVSIVITDNDPGLLAITGTDVPASTAGCDKNITLTGANFGLVAPSSLSVTLGTLSCRSPVWQSSSTVVCTCPPGVGAGLAVALVLAGITATPGPSPVAFSYRPPSVSSVVASAGVPWMPRAGGLPVTLVGANFGSAVLNVTATVGGTACAAPVWLSSSMIQCSVPSGAGTGAGVAVEVGGQLSAPFPGFSYMIPPGTVTAVSPAQGLARAGAVITIYGTAPLAQSSSDVASLAIAGVRCAGVNVTSPTTIECTAGASDGAATGGVALATFSSGAPVPVAPGAATTFAFVSSTVTALAPAVLSTSGGTVVTLYGSGFSAAVGASGGALAAGSPSGALNITLGGVPCGNPVVAGDSVITCVAGATTGAIVNGTLVLATAFGGVATVTRNVTGSAGAPSLFTYYRPPAVTGVSPSVGPLLGGFAVTVFGSNLEGVGSVTLGTSPCASPARVSPLVVTCVAGPSGVVGNVTVAVSLQLSADVTARSATPIFVYQSPALAPREPVVVAIVPAPTGDYLGGLSLTLTGINFGVDKFDLVAVRIGTASCRSFAWVSSTVVTCVTPPAAAAGRQVVTVETLAGGRGTTGAAFVYTVPAPVLLEALPRDLRLQGGDPVTLTGAFFGSGAPNGTGFAIFLGNVSCASSTWLSSSSLLCVTPPRADVATDAPLVSVRFPGFAVTAPVSLSLAYRPASFKFCTVNCGSKGFCDGTVGQCACSKGWVGPPLCAERMLQAAPSAGSKKDLAANKHYTSEDSEGALTFLLALAAAPTRQVQVRGVTQLPASRKEDDVQVSNVVVFQSKDFGAKEIRLVGRANDVRDPEFEFTVRFVTSSEDPNFDGLESEEFPLLQKDSTGTFDAVSPTVIPLHGTSMTVKGENFDQSMRVYVEGVECPIISATTRSGRTIKYDSKGKPTGEGRLAARQQVYETATLESVQSFVFATPALNSSRLRKGGYVKMEIVGSISQVNTTSTDDLYYTDECPNVGFFGEDCEPCPAGAICPGGNRVWPLPGYWNPGETSGYVIKCDPEEACLGYRNTTCAAGYTGEVCGACIKSYYRSANRCIPCPEPVSYQINMICDAIVWVSFGLCVAFMTRRHHLSYVFLGVRSLQSIAGLGSMANGNVPRWIVAVYEFLHLFSGDYQFLKPDCGKPVPWSRQFFASVGYSIVLVLPALLVTSFMWAISKEGKREEKVPQDGGTPAGSENEAPDGSSSSGVGGGGGGGHGGGKVREKDPPAAPQKEAAGKQGPLGANSPELKSEPKSEHEAEMDIGSTDPSATKPAPVIVRDRGFYRNRFVRATQISLIFLYLPLTSAALATLSCRPNTNKTIYHMVTLPYEICYTKEKWFATLVASLILVFLTAGFPIAVLYHLFRPKELETLHREGDFKSRWDIFYEFLALSSPYFWVIDYPVLFIVAAGRSALKPEAVAQLTMSVIVFAIKLLYIIAKRPYHSQTSNIIQGSMAVASLIVINMNFFTRQDIGSFSSVASGLAVVVFTTLVGQLIFIMFMFMTSTRFYMRYKERRAKRELKEEQDAKMGEGDGTMDPQEAKGDATKQANANEQGEAKVQAPTKVQAQGEAKVQAPTKVQAQGKEDGAQNTPTLAALPPLPNLTEHKAGKHMPSLVPRLPFPNPIKMPHKPVPLAPPPPLPLRKGGKVWQPFDSSSSSSSSSDQHSRTLTQEEIARIISHPPPLITHEKETHLPFSSSSEDL